MGKKKLSYQDKRKEIMLYRVLKMLENIQHQMTKDQLNEKLEEDPEYVNAYINDIDLSSKIKDKGISYGNVLKGYYIKQIKYNSKKIIFQADIQ